MTSRSVVLTDHAVEQARRRDVPEGIVLTVAAAAEQIVPIRPGREIRQSQIALGGTIYLIRAVVDLGADMDTVVTVYRTSKIEKYWRPR